MGVCAWSDSRPPNIVFIVADDLGYGDLGCYGQKKIRTPHLDALARDGMKFTRHYAGNAVCAPSRCVLMTGLHPGHAVVRNNREMQPEGQFPLPASAVTIASILKQKGYATGAFGKWGLGGMDTTGSPLKQGFDRFYGYNCQAKAHNYYPQSLWDNDKVVELDNPPIPNREKLPANSDPQSSASYAKYAGKEYSADLIANEARKFVRDHKDESFFLFWPTTVPHLALQVPEDSLAEYRGKWPDPPYRGNHGYVPQFSPRATYAAMITRMDYEIGALLKLLDELGLSDDTLVVFTSDNGPSHGNTGGADSEFFNSAGGLRGLKGSLFEGGIRVPLIVRWPGKIKPGTVCERVTGFEDWMPTLLEVASRDAAALPVKIDGMSFSKSLFGEKQPERPFLYREFPAYGGQQSVLKDEWKLVRQNLKPGKNDEASTPSQELFNLREDPTESKDVSASHPERVRELEAIMKREHVPSDEFPMKAID